MNRSCLLGLLLLVFGSGCSHTWFQFQVSPNERSHISNTVGALAASSRDPNALAQVVDLPGRRAVETLIAGMSLERTDGDPQFQRLLRALYIGVMGDREDPLAALDVDLAVAAARVGQRLASQGLGQMGLGGLAAMAGVALGNDDGQRLREMQASIGRGQIASCQDFEVVVSYDAGILGHIHSQLAEQDPNYVAWRARVRAIHLVSFTCRSGHALMVLTRNANEANLRVIGWHWLTPGQWQAMRPRMRAAFDIPD